ncbi:MAG: GntR family transcriptional regulator [Gammaproteobacteria bacterium]|jgi:GntR family transcriptional regulator
MPAKLEKAGKKLSLVSPLPLFTQIKETVRNRIMDGTYSVHSKLPSERELGEIFNVSRVTVRQALSELQREGLIFKINGKGTFVSKPKAALEGSKLRGFGEAMSSLGYESVARVLSITEEASNKCVANKLNIEVGALVSKIQRLRYLNRDPISLDITYVRPDVGRIMANSDLEDRDIISLLENECDVQLGKAKMNIEAVLSDEMMSCHLGLEEGGPILHIERTLLTSENQPVLYENLYYSGDVFRYSLDVQR